MGVWVEAYAIKGKDIDDLFISLFKNIEDIEDIQKMLHDLNDKEKIIKMVKEEKFTDSKLVYNFEPGIKISAAVRDSVSYYNWFGVHTCFGLNDPDIGIFKSMKNYENNIESDNVGYGESNNFASDVKNYLSSCFEESELDEDEDEESELDEDEDEESESDEDEESLKNAVYLYINIQ